MLLFSTLLAFVPLVFGNPSRYPIVDCTDVGLYSTPTYGLVDAVFSVCASITIKGTTKQVCDAILDFRRYSEWNTFVYNAIPPAGVDSPAQVRVGMPIRFSSTGIPPGSSSNATDIVTVVRRPLLTAWKNDELEALIGHSEHVSAFTPLGGGWTRYTHWQTQYGEKAREVLLPLKDHFQHQFEVLARDLKGYVERN
ncbi:hypothetical protein McanMca71_004784 [Microsporum canis]|uniref:Polyketide cyclase/dehydrase n=1 Tax=Arthroderma otae (strain ATCC MYA-4605 / CBS 113480) TaxID=554155 RepID=C5FZP4_ARTOC|nr:uncharacterized protein MCYG_08166 [Microsporum canis CBS 113480]EEQ35347.1 predicted protein [Microsporum canis CBS 113480]